MAKANYVIQLQQTVIEKVKKNVIIDALKFMLSVLIVLRMSKFLTAF